MTDPSSTIPIEILKSLEQSDNCGSFLATTRDTLNKLKSDRKLLLPQATYLVLQETLHLLLLIRGSKVNLEHNMKDIKQDAYSVGQIEFLQYLLTNCEIEI